jgi:hypothetical protein
VVAVAKDGKGFTLEVRARGEEPRRIDVKYTDKTQVTYDRVGPGEAKLTEGCGARAWLKEGSKDTAARVSLTGNGGPRGRRRTIEGQVVSVAADGKGVTLGARGARADERGVDVKFTAQTRITFSAVENGGAKPSAGYFAQAWLEPGSTDTAARIGFHGNRAGGRGGTPPDRSGKVVAIAKDGKGLTLELPPAERGAEATRLEIKLTDKTRALFHGIGPGGAMPAEGYTALVWLEKGSKDTAAQVVFRGGAEERAQEFTGKVVGVAADGKGVTVEVAERRGTEVRTVDVKCTDHTEIVYNGVGPDGARPTKGYSARVRLEEGSKDTAGQVVFFQPGTGRR